jgi:hypothetical protein
MAQSAVSIGTAIEAVEARLKGPGGMYNLGNAVALTAGLALHTPSNEAASASAFGTAFDFLAGSGGALALTIASLVFFWGGEVYHRAFSGSTPDMAAKRFGDFLSGVGAVALGIGLLMIGDPMMALFAGLLHATGKFATAFGSSGSAWGYTVLFSRVPAILAALAGISAALSIGTTAAIAAPAAVLVSCLLWAKADLMLMRPAPAAMNAVAA